MSDFAERIRVLSLKSGAERVLSEALIQGLEIKSYVDADLEPPPELVARFLATYQRGELMYLEWMLADQQSSDPPEQIEIRFHGESEPLFIPGREDE